MPLVKHKMCIFRRSECLASAVKGCLYLSLLLSISINDLNIWENQGQITRRIKKRSLKLHNRTDGQVRQEITGANCLEDSSRRLTVIETDTWRHYTTYLIPLLNSLQLKET